MSSESVTASINVCFFARLRQEMGVDVVSIPHQSGMTIREIWHLVAHGRQPPPNLLAACNHDYCKMDTVVSAGDEVAFFPPVTGG